MIVSNVSRTLLSINHSPFLSKVSLLDLDTVLFHIRDNEPMPGPLHSHMDIVSLIFEVTHVRKLLSISDLGTYLAFSSHIVRYF
uniref:Ovule protein n=1 Tax=Panagrellus redivivus TaxID=6233 RepID=A0A7E4UVE7_PANRE